MLAQAVCLQMEWLNSGEVEFREICRNLLRANEQGIILK